MREISRAHPPWTLPMVAGAGVAGGASALVSKHLLGGGVHPFMVGGLPFLAGGVAATIALGARRRFTSRAIAPGVLLGLIGIATPAGLINLGFERLPAALVVVLISLGPVFTAVIANFVYEDERFVAAQVVGLVAACAGVCALVIDTPADGTADLIGLGLVVVGAVFVGIGNNLARPRAARYGVALISPQMLTAGTVSVLAALLLDPEPLGPRGPTAELTLWLIAMALLACANIGLQVLVQARLTAGAASTVFYFVVLTGGVGGVVVFGDPVTSWMLLGSACIVAGSALVISGRSRMRLHLVKVRPPTRAE